MASEEEGQQREAKRWIAEARVKTGDFIARLVMAYVGFAVFCVFALLSPDRLMIDAQASLNMPLAGTVSFLAFMVVAPVVLIGMRVYLEIYLQRWRQLDGQLDAESEPKTVSPLKHPLLRRVSAVVFYPLLPAMLVLFTWKAAGKEHWGEIFLLLTAICAAAQVYQFVCRRWSRRAARIAAVSGSLLVFALVWVLYEWSLPHRGLNLFRENLYEAYLVGEDLRFADLRDANLAGARLTRADLTRANLTDANLTGARLSGADLTGADLTGADLSGADVSGADLTDAVLWEANLTRADLTHAYFTDADFWEANLTGADLTGADLTGADLSDAHLTGADLTGADLADASFLPDLSEACADPEKPPALPEDIKPSKLWKPCPAETSE